MGEGAAPEAAVPSLLAQPPDSPPSVPSASATTIPDRVVAPEWTAPAPSRMAITPLHGLLVLEGRGRYGGAGAGRDWGAHRRVSPLRGAGPNALG
jgi:hypothetical protein